MKEIIFREFSKLMTKRKRTLEDLVEIFRGKIEEPREFFERVLTCKYKHEDRSDAVIPYSCAIEFYQKELHYLKDCKRRPARLRDVEKSGIRTREIIAEF